MVILVDKFGFERGGVYLYQLHACGFVHGDLKAANVLVRDEGGAVLTDFGLARRSSAPAGSSPQVPVSGSLFSIAPEVLLGETRLALQSSRSADTTAIPSNPRLTVVNDGSSADWARQTSIDIVAAAVREERPDLSAMQDDSGTVTIVFSDIERSTERAVALGDVEWMKVLEEHNRLVRKQVTVFGGTEIKSQGDGFMLSFPGARRAVLAMIEIQRALNSLEESDPDRAVRVRMGCHTGEVIVDDVGDLFGKHVIVAARIANLAGGGEILVSTLVKDLVSARGDVAFRETRDVDLKGIDGRWEVHLVDWDRADPDAG